MSLPNQEQFESAYNAGKDALERGKYRLSVQHLESACELVPRSSRLGGEVQMWLVMAYQAAGMMTEAKSLCRELTTHLNIDIRQKAKDILYIIEAPQLNRPAEWMSEIPDLTVLSESEIEYRRGRGANRPEKNPDPEIPPLIESEVQDNQFIWVAFLLILLTLIGLVWFNQG